MESDSVAHGFLGCQSKMSQNTKLRFGKHRFFPCYFIGLMCDFLIDCLTSIFSSVNENLQFFYFKNYFKNEYNNADGPL